MRKIRRVRLHIGEHEWEAGELWMWVGVALMVIGALMFVLGRFL